MVRLTPTQRLEWLLDQPDLSNAHAKINELLSCYERFLRTTNQTETALITAFTDKETSLAYMKDAREFGDILFEALTTIGAGNPFLRLLVV